MSRYFKPESPGRFPEALGFRSAAQSVHGSRTIMLADLRTLLAAVPAAAAQSEYQQAIMEDNVLGKKTASTRLWAWKKLRELYSLDFQMPVFRLLRQFWDIDQEGRPMLAVIAAMARDALLRASASVIAATRPGEPVSREAFAKVIIAERGERFSQITMHAVLSHLLSSWTESGHLAGRKDKVRAQARATTAATAYALALGYLTGTRGELLFSTPWTSILDAPAPVLHDQAREASRFGWLTYRGVGNIVEISFPSIGVSQQELLTHE